MGRLTVRKWPNQRLTKFGKGLERGKIALKDPDVGSEMKRG